MPSTLDFSCLNLPLLALGGVLVLLGLGLRRLFGLALHRVWPQAVLVVAGVAAMAAVLVMGRCPAPSPPLPPPPPAPPPPISFEDCVKRLQPPAEASPSRPPPRDPTRIGIAGGEYTLTYYAMAKDIAQVARLAKPVPLDFVPIETRGTLHNLELMDGPDNAAIGFAQSDVLDYLRQHGSAAQKGYAARLRLVMPLYSEEVHVLAARAFKNRSVGRLADLVNLPVVTASSSEGSLVTARNLLRLAGAQAPDINSSAGAVESVCAVVAGKAAAMVVVAGQPATLFSRLALLPAADLRRLQFVPLDDLPKAPGYESATLTSYPQLGGAVPTVSVRAVLVDFDFSGRRTPHQIRRCQQLGALAKVLREEEAQLHKPDAHPKWSEVRPNQPVAGWEWDRCTHTGLLPTVRPSPQR